MLSQQAVRIGYLGSLHRGPGVLWSLSLVDCRKKQKSLVIALSAYFVHDLGCGTTTKKIKILTRSKMRSIKPHAWYCIGPPDATKLALFCQKVETGIMTCLSSSSIVLSRLKYWINVAGRLQTLSQCTGLLRVSFWFAMGSSFSHLLFFFIFFPRFFYFLVNPIAAYLLHV